MGPDTLILGPVHQSLVLGTPGIAREGQHALDYHRRRKRLFISFFSDLYNMDAWKTVLWSKTPRKGEKYTVRYKKKGWEIVQEKQGHCTCKENCCINTVERFRGRRNHEKSSGLQLLLKLAWPARFRWFVGAPRERKTKRKTCVRQNQDLGALTAIKKVFLCADDAIFRS